MVLCVTATAVSPNTAAAGNTTAAAVFHCTFARHTLIAQFAQAGVVILGLSSVEAVVELPPPRVPIHGTTDRAIAKQKTSETHFAKHSLGSP